MDMVTPDPLAVEDLRDAYDLQIFAALVMTIVIFCLLTFRQGCVR